jgi:hypothetical protein
VRALVGADGSTGIPVPVNEARFSLLLLYCCFTAALLLLYCCFAAALPVNKAPLGCCFTAALLLRYCCFTAACALLTPGC